MSAILQSEGLDLRGQFSATSFLEVRKFDCVFSDPCSWTPISRSARDSDFTMGKKSKGRNEVDELEVLKRELAKAWTKGDFKEVSNLHNRIGILYREASLYEEALDEHEEEAIVTRKYFPNDLLGLGMALRAKGEVYIEMKEEEKALPLVKEFLRLALAAGDLVEEQRAHVTLGRVYYALALQHAEEGREEEKLKKLKKAENQFVVAKDLTRNPKIRISDSEASEMRCGVYINLFLVLESAGREHESLNFLRKAVELAESYALHDLLFRAHLNFYEVHFRKKEFEEAVNSAQAAASTAKLLRDPKLQAEAGILQAKANFLKNDIDGGVSVLKRIRKDKKKIAFVEEELEPLLKAGVRIIRTEDKIHSCSNTRRKAKLYEILGDKFVEIGNFLQATINYELALKCVEENSMGDKKKAELLFSLAETLNDMGKFHDARKTYLAELRLHENNNPAEAFKTQARICSLLEKADFSEEEILDAHRSALDFAKDSQSPAKELEALGNFAAFLRSRKRQHELEKVLKEIEDLRKLYPFAEEECSENDKLDDRGNQSDSGSSIDLNRLTSDEGESEDPEENAPRAITTATKKKFRLNEKGETPLHVAAKKGDLKAVRRLLRQGHEVNPRDSAGWIPLHEAANFGHYEVVEELLKNGARVNDQPAGPNCDKITPLHDAAANGHVNLVHLFVDHGANVLLKDANGNYPIDSLLICFQRGKSEFTIDVKNKFKETLDLLKKKMAEKGKIYGTEDERRAKRRAKDCDEDGRAQPSFLVQRDKLDKVPVRVDLDDFDPDDGTTAVDFYSNTMKGLRGKKKEEPSVERSSRKHAQALIAEDNYVDEDWLDDDLGNLRGRTNKRKRRDSGRSEELTLSPRRKKENRREDVLVDLEFVGNRKCNRTKSPSIRPTSTKKPSRLRLASSSDEDCVIQQSDSEFSSSVNPSTSRSRVTDDIDLLEIPSSPPVASSSTSTYRSRPVRKDIPKKPDRLTKTTSSVTSTSSEIFSRPDIRLKDIKALSNSLQCQFSLKEINLSGALMFDDGLKVLKTVLPALRSLSILDISLNGITREGLNHLREGYSSKTHVQGQALTSLNLNYNPLGNDCGYSLIELLGLFVNLKKLYLADADLTRNTIEDTSLPALLAKLQLEELDLRYNDLSGTAKTVLMDSGVFNQMQIFNKKKFDPRFPV